MKSLRARMFAVIATVSILVVPLAAGSADAAKTPVQRVTAMTRNVYLGADINRPIAAALTAQAQGKSPAEILVALANATHETRAIVDQTNFPVRAKLLADEITRTEPDLIGLQEVALWRSGPLELGNVGVPNATIVDYDFLQVLLDALEARGAHYRAVSIRNPDDGNRADVEAPSFTGSPLNGTISSDAKDIRLTMRDVVLMHVEDGLTDLDTDDEIYSNNLSITAAGATFEFDRGYQWVDVRAGDTSFRFVNTHLEAFSSNLALAQATELLSATAIGRSTVLVCDCNSDPLNSSIKPGDSVPHKAPYELITSSSGGGFTDEWLQKAPAEDGWTSGLSELVNDLTGAGFDHRIDMIFGRTADGAALGVDRGQVTGTNADTDRDKATGLWPSDHGGVVLRLRGL